ncbi:Hypothetical protein PHPALM_14917 [Phytophthora palmivora]|uniref:Uncharacterized protein n=1 Tax=Phytophthora palmivora TaxID=4796 RepID=A0A2P4XTH3_9STRA|nr:Hypothetical protein PHPALM_14917 [Phytophthora palmivora]
MVTKLIPVTSTRLPSHTADDSSLQFSPAAPASSSQQRKQSVNAKKREALRRRKATLFATVAARRLNDRHPLSLHEEVGEEYMRCLRVLFHASDANEDNAITPNELLVLHRS